MTIVDDFYFLTLYPELPFPSFPRTFVFLAWIKTHCRARAPYFSVTLIPVVIFCSGREKNEREKDFRMDTERAGTGDGRGTKGFIIGHRSALATVLN